MISRNNENALRDTDLNNWFFVYVLLFICLGFLSFFTNSYLSDNSYINFFVQLLLPFAILFYITKSAFFSLVLLTLNDIFLVNQSIFFSSLGIPLARSILFLTLLLIFLCKAGILVTNFSRVGLAVLFYGIIFPGILITLSLILGNANMNLILQDILWIFPVLIYFPLKHVLLRFKFKIFAPWIISISFLQFLYSLTISLSPRNIGVILYKQYSNLSADEVVISHAENVEGFLENASTSFILAYITFFLSFFVLIFRTINVINRILIILLMFISIAPLLIDNLRGPLIAALIVLFILVLILLVNRKRSLKIISMFTWLVFFIILGIIYVHSIIPEIFNNYIDMFTTSSSIIGDVRSEQRLHLINEFKSNWLFGRGLGSGLSNGFSRSTTGFDFELQYHMFLYKYGLFFFIIQFIPIIWFIIQLIKLPNSLTKSGYTISSMVQFSILLAIIANLIASYTNPYLKTGFLSGAIGVFLSMYFVNNSSVNNHG